MSGSGRVTPLYFFGPEDTTNTDAPTASRKARRDEVRLPWCPTTKTCAASSLAQHVSKTASIELGDGGTARRGRDSDRLAASVQKHAAVAVFMTTALHVQPLALLRVGCNLVSTAIQFRGLSIPCNGWREKKPTKRSAAPFGFVCSMA